MLHFDNKLCLPDGVSSKIIDFTLINLIIHEVSLLASFRNIPGFSRNTGILTDEYDNNNKNNKRTAILRMGSGKTRTTIIYNIIPIL